MLDIGAGEFIALAILALIVLGPEKLPRYAADAARMLRRVREMANEARSQVSSELGPEFEDISLRDLNPRSMVRKHLLEPVDLDSLGDGDDDRPRRQKPANRRGPDGSGGPSGSGGQPAVPGTSTPPYDSDAT